MENFQIDGVIKAYCKKIHWFKNISPFSWLLIISFLQLETKSKMYCLVVTTDKTTHCYSLLYYYHEIH